MERIGYNFMQRVNRKKQINKLFEKLKDKREKVNDLFGEVTLSSGKRVSEDLFLYPLVAALGRAILKNVSQGRKLKKDNLLWLLVIFLSPQ